jgi:heme-binding NEAT domain protein
LTMKKSALLVALSAASLAGGIGFAQTYPQTTQPQTTQPEATKPSGADTKPGTTTTRPAMDDASFSLATLDTNKDGVVDKQEARASASLTAIFDKADTNRDGKLDAAELSAAASMAKRQ